MSRYFVLVRIWFYFLCLHRLDYQLPVCPNFLHTFQRKTWRRYQQWFAFYMISSQYSLLSCSHFLQYFSFFASKHISGKDLKKFLKGDGKWRTFDEFTDQKFAIWTIVIDAGKVHKSTCTCPPFLKSLLFKHTVGMCIR